MLLDVEETNELQEAELLSNRGETKMKRYLCGDVDFFRDFFTGRRCICIPEGCKHCRENHEHHEHHEHQDNHHERPEHSCTCFD